MVAAALSALPEDAPEVTAAGAWKALLCGSTIDCPPARLRAATPRGSVVISFVDHGPDAWLNVIEVPAAGSWPATTEAWIVRWNRPQLASPSPSGSSTSGPADSG